MSPSKNKKNVIGITLGDPSGIGAEIVIKSLSEIKLLSNTRILLIGDSCLINSLHLSVDIPFYKNVDKWAKNEEKIALLDPEILNSSHRIEYGVEKKEYGRVAFTYLKKAVGLLKENKINKLVTAPVNKEVISSSGVDFKGHTEFLAEEFNVDEVVMMLFSGSYRFVLLTRHIPIKKVSENITKPKIIRNVEIVEEEVRRIFSLKEVKMGIAGLNPHLGDRGLIAREEEEVIKPAIKKLSQNYNIEGPTPMESLIHRLKNNDLDVVFCHYHDQATLTLKMLAPDRGVNLTLGLPFIRTSPFHGTAYDIAGKDKASPDSMIETLEFTMSA